MLFGKILHSAGLCVRGLHPPELDDLRTVGAFSNPVPLLVFEPVVATAVTEAMAITAIPTPVTNCVRRWTRRFAGDWGAERWNMRGTHPVVVTHRDVRVGDTGDR